MAQEPDDIHAVMRRRIQYEAAGFDVADADDDPVRQFERWFLEAVPGLDQPNAVVLATAGSDGRPSARTVLLKGMVEGGPVFFTNRRSAKARAIGENPFAELLFVWIHVHRQVRIAGPVVAADDAVADEYFAGRPRESQLSAWASPQSEVVADRAALEAAVAEAAERFEGEDVPRPPFWGGYRLEPETWEFWQGRSNRLHDRVRYRRADGAWVRERLAP